MFNSSAFPLHRAIDRHPLTVTPDTPVLQVVMLMSQARASCVLVVKQQQLLGIFTERDVVRVTAAGIALEGVAIAAVMTSRIVTLKESSAQDLLAVLSLLRQYRIRHVPIVDEVGQLVGILSHESMREVLQPADLLKLRPVSEVMATQVIRAPTSASVLHVTQLMTAHHVSCIIISHLESDRRSCPVGIITERDIVQLRALGLNLTQTQAQTVMSAPLLPIRPEDSLWAAHEKMRQHRIRRLVVVDDAGELVGIITQTSMLQVLDPMETYAALEALQRVVEERTTDLQKTNEQLQSEIIDRQQIEAALRLSQARLAGILNSADDAIISVDENQRIQIFNQGSEKTFGYTAGEILGQPLDLLFSQTLLGAHCRYSDEIVESGQVSQKLGEYREVFGRRKDGTEFPAEASISEVKVGDETILTIVLRDITERQANQEALQNQLAKERLMGAIAQRIRQSLNLDTILNTTVAEVRQFLQTDRVIIYRFHPDWSGVILVESVAPNWMPLLGRIIKDRCFAESYVQYYQNGRIQATTDIYNAGLSQCRIDILAPLQIRANLVVPILRGEELWGLLGVHQCSDPRQWQQLEIDLIKQLATQVGIAIQQAQLYQQLEEANQKLHGLANLDGLTQVANRRCFDESLEKEWRRLARERSPLSLIMCDVDFFKLYNDHYQHQAGDECLQQIASAMRRAVKRSADLVARYGGEEFAVLLPNTNANGAVQVAQEIHFRVKLLKIAHAKSLISEYVTFSMGVSSMIPSLESTPARLIAAADTALYQAKDDGRDRIILSNEIS